MKPRAARRFDAVCRMLLSLAMVPVGGGVLGQTIPPGTVPLVIVTTSGGNGGNGTDGESCLGCLEHRNGGAAPTPAPSGGAITLVLSNGTTVTNGAQGPIVAATANGGNGGTGGDGGSTGSWSNGGAGAAGGAGGPIRLTLQSGSIANGSGGGPAIIQLSGAGGAGGAGGGIGSYGTAGMSGAGGPGAAISFSQASGSQVASSGAAASVLLLFNPGGTGADGTSTETESDSAFGVSGGAGGGGGTIAVNIGGSIASSMSGVTAVSSGGNGGMGGTAGITFSGGLNTSVNGGDGGIGGDGGFVQLSLLPTATVSATGPAGAGTGQQINLGNGATAQLTPLVAGLLAQSVGGVGGNGGTADGGFSKGVAGSGGNAGAGGTVSIQAAAGGVVSTTGYAAAGMLAQSIGGAAGTGANAGAVFYAQGGQGGNGGPGGQASLQIASGTVRTQGDDSDAVVAQSIGGGGGYGGDVQIGGIASTVSIGGLGGGGGEGGAVGVTNGFSEPQPTPGFLISTKGDSSRGILAQSIAGGGGRGGEASSIDFGILSVAIGGSARAGGSSGNATVYNSGVIQTAGQHSTGILAQSIAGGGGVGGGGNSVTIGVQVTTAVAVGGSGGAGGAAGTVSVQNDGQIVTLGPDAIGIVAQSVGGGGGSGGASAAHTYQLYSSPDIPSVNLKVSLGGSGNTGGIGNTVTVVNNGPILTSGLGSAGVLAQSIGGGGGNGGDSTAGGVSFKGSTFTVTTTIGGDGGSGAGTGPVTVTNNGLVVTLANSAPGLMAQSVAGGGGAGGTGSSNTGVYYDADKQSLQFTLALGGSGGSSNQASTVTVNNQGGGIVTRGDASPGIRAQSIGGGGGDAGGAIADGSGGSISVNLAIGGDAGNGNKGGAITVTNSGAILTGGGSAAGIFAQSVGGGGGNGGNAASGSGTNAEITAANFLASGMGINQDVISRGDGIYTFANYTSSGFGVIDKLKSLSNSYNANNGAPPDTPQEPATSTWSLDIGGGIGGGAGSGNDGGTVIVSNTGAGAIVTNGPASPGIFAQSVGGGGGTGGISNPSTGNNIVSNDIGNLKKFSVPFGVGGNGGIGGDGGLVQVMDSGSIATSGDASYGIHAQSVGGGGGVGGQTAANPGALNKLTISIGGNGGANGSGGETDVTLSPAGDAAIISTSGGDAAGILAQSIGGGGGLAVVMAAFPAGNGGGKGTSKTTDLPTTTLFNVLINGEGGAAGNGGPVNVVLNNQSQIATSGINAYGVVAQSVGGGGGLVLGPPIANAASTLSGVYAGPGNGNGGTVTVTLNNSSIMTTGPGAAGILAQSIGGGGGIIGGLASVTLGTKIVDNPTPQTGQGGNINVTLGPGSSIVTVGANAPAIFAQAVGGGGGIISEADGKGFTYGAPNEFLNCSGNGCTGQVRVTVAGEAIARGNGSYGVYAESRGNYYNDVFVTVQGGGIIIADPGAAAAVFVAGSGRDVITVDSGGAIIANGPEGVAINSVYIPVVGSTVVNNAGVIVGSVYLAGSTNRPGAAPGTNLAAVAAGTLNNLPGGTLNAGKVVNLGAGGQLNNAGTLQIGRTGVVEQTILTGHLVQSAPGTLQLDIDFANPAAANQADRLNIIGSATVAGTISVHALSLAMHSVTVLTASEGVVVDPALTGSRTQLFEFKPVGVSNTIQIRPQADFRNPVGGGVALSDTQSQVAGHLQSIWDSGSAMGGAFSMLLKGINDPVSYTAALNSLSGQTLGAITAFRFASSRSFISTMYSCPAYAPGTMLSVESDCAWARVLGNQTSQDSTSGSLGYNASSTTTQIAGQKQLAPNWFLGATIAYERSGFSGAQGTSQVIGDGLLAGAVVKYEDGPWLLSGGLDTGYGWYSSSRLVSVGNAFASIAKASPTAWHVGVSGRVAYQIPFERWYMKPSLDLHAAYVGSSAYTESGAAPFNLAVQSAAGGALAATAAIEIGTIIDFGHGGRLRPYASAGMGVLSTDGWTTTARFAGVQDSNSFRASTPLPIAVGRFAAGVDLYATESWGIKLQYTGDVSGSFQSHTGSARASWSF